MPVSEVRVKAFDLFLEQVEKDIQNAQTQRDASQADSNAAPSPMQSHHDTLRQEADALAGGHEKILAGLTDLRKTLARIREACIAIREEITAGALVTLEGEDALNRYFVIPGGRGKKISPIEGLEYTCINPQTPAAKAMMGKTVGDEVTIAVQGNTRTLEIIEIL